MKNNQIKFDIKFENFKNLIAQQNVNEITTAEEPLNNLKKELDEFTKKTQLSAETACKEIYLKALSLVEEKKKHLNDLKTLQKLDIELNKTKNEYEGCRSNEMNVSNDLQTKFMNLNSLVKIAEGVCFDQCKTELREKKLGENFANKCLSNCFKYKKLNMESTYEVLKKEIDNKLNSLNKA
jgi:phosphopantetheinyl transferase (holo-ACP synthase)